MRATVCSPARLSICLHVCIYVFTSDYYVFPFVRLYVWVSTHLFSVTSFRLATYANSCLHVINVSAYLDWWPGCYKVIILAEAVYHCPPACLPVLLSVCLPLCLQVFLRYTLSVFVLGLFCFCRPDVKHRRYSLLFLSCKSSISLYSIGILHILLCTHLFHKSVFSCLLSLCRSFSLALCHCLSVSGVCVYRWWLRSKKDSPSGLMMWYTSGEEWTRDGAWRYTGWGCAGHF